MTGRRGRARSSDPRPPPDPSAAQAIAERFLATRPRTRDEVVRRLRRAGVSDGVVDETLARLQRLGYVDDEAFSRYWVEQRDAHGPRGRRALAAELRRLGVADSDASLALDDARDDAQRAAAALEKHTRGRPLEPSDAAAVARAVAFLRRRGFDYGTALRAVREGSAGESETWLDMEQGDD